MMMMGRMADTDKDGAVSQAEFMAAAMQRFDRADANHDGTVTRDERKAAFQAMRGHMREGRHRGMGEPGAQPAPTPAN
jgi:hypothetical protein